MAKACGLGRLALSPRSKQAEPLRLYVFRDHMPVEQVADAMGVARVVGVVRDHDDGRPISVQLRQQVHHLIAVCRVHACLTWHHIGPIFERLQYIVRVYTHIYVHVVKYLHRTSNKCTHVGTPQVALF